MLWDEARTVRDHWKKTTRGEARGLARPGVGAEGGFEAAAVGVGVVFGALLAHCGRMRGGMWVVDMRSKRIEVDRAGIAWVDVDSGKKVKNTHPKLEITVVCRHTDHANALSVPRPCRSHTKIACMRAKKGTTTSHQASLRSQIRSKVRSTTHAHGKQIAKKKSLQQPASQSRHHSMF